MQFSCGFKQLNRPSFAQFVQRNIQQSKITKLQAQDSTKEQLGYRDIWIPEGENYGIPDYLDGSLPGDRGFDPFGLSKNPTARSWLANGELYNARWAMLGSLGIISAGLAQHYGWVKDQTPWWDAAKIYPFPFVELGGNYVQIIFGAQVLIFFFLEIYRIIDWWNPKGEQTSPNGNYPGGKYFDPLRFGELPPEQFRQYQEREIRNGRLAMASWFAYNFQAFTTGKGPIENLFDHIADPTVNNILNNGIKGPVLPDFPVGPFE